MQILFGAWRASDLSRVQWDGECSRSARVSCPCFRSRCQKPVRQGRHRTHSNCMATCRWPARLLRLPVRVYYARAIILITIPPCCMCADLSRTSSSPPASASAGRVPTAPPLLSHTGMSSCRKGSASDTTSPVRSRSLLFYLSHPSLEPSRFIRTSAGVAIGHLHRDAQA